MLGRFTTAQLEHLVEKFPSFQQAYLLLAKKYQDENNPKFDQQLQLAALYTNDRELLYSIFHQKNILPTDIAAEPELLEEEYIEPPQAETVSIQFNKINAEEAVEIEQLIKETEKAPAIELVEETPPTPITEPAKEEEPAIETFSPAEPHTFGDWLKAFGQMQVTTFAPATAETPPVIPPEEADEELNKVIMQNTSVGYLHEQMEEETRYSKGLDKFIEEQIEKHKYETAPVEPPPNAENDLDSELITETMAKVYEMQKKYARAIKAYETLTLKYPEKSSFFAARINYLKNII